MRNAYRYASCILVRTGRRLHGILPDMWSIAFVAVGLFAWLGAFVHWRRVTAWLAGSVRTDAEIVRLEGSMPGQDLPPVPERSPRLTAYPVVRFRLPDGELHEGRSRMGMAYSRLESRSSIAVAYDPDNPSDIRLGAHADRGMSVTLFGMGTIVLVLGIIGLL